MGLTNNIKNALKNITILDKYVLRQVVEIFVLGVAVFSSIFLASQAFTELIKKIADYGMPPKIAFMLIILNLPAVIVQTIPMSMLLATIMGINKLCLASEITVMRACGIGINRIAKPIFVFAVLMSILSFGVNELIVPATGTMSKNLLAWSIGQKNIPDGKKNYTLKEVKDKYFIKRFFYVENCTKKELDNVSIIDFSNENKTQIIQSTKGETADSGWVFKNASIYTIDENGKLMNTSWVDKTTVDFGIDVKEDLMKINEFEYNSKQLADYIKNGQFENERERNSYRIMFHQRFSLPITTVIFALIGIPLAITPPRVRYNRGFLLSIGIILIFYLLRAFITYPLGESGILPPVIAVWIPNILIGTIGFFAYKRIAYKIT